MPAAILAGTLPGGGSINLFSSPPPNPCINDPHFPKPPPLPPIPRRRPPKPKPQNPNPNTALKSPHSRTKYYKPISVSSTGGVISADATAGSVVVGDSGLSYLLPGAPFEFQYSYSETPKAAPLAMREPAFLPFAPPTMPRPWTGKAPLKSKKEKAMKKQRRVRLVESLEEEEEVGKVVMELARPVDGLVQRAKDGRSREEILGSPLSKKEVRELIKPYLSSSRQLNLGRDGLTHNMLESIHCHWKRQPVCKVRCRGVPTVDMDNVSYHLEDKTGGKIIYRVGGVVYLFRGRNYDPRTRPRYPVMLWKPAAPVYPKLIQEAPEGLTKLEADALREKGRNLLPICKLAKNGIYINLVQDVRDAFEETPLVKINCQGLDASDYKKIGAKLKDLVPCVLLSFDEEQILVWRGKSWKSRCQVPNSEGFRQHPLDKDQGSLESDCSGCRDKVSTKSGISSSRMLSLWNHAMECKKALLIDVTTLSPDALQEKVEEFSSISQATEHSYPALVVLPASGGAYLPKALVDESEIEHELDVESSSFEEFESTVPYGSIPLDIIAKRLDSE